jgi:WD40 repeat protein
MNAILAAAVVAKLVSQLGHNSYVHAVAISPDSRFVLTASADQTAKLWDAASGAELRTFSGHSEEVKAAAFSPDGTLALTGSRDGTARLWDAGSGDELRRFDASRGGVNAVAFSPDGQSIIAGGWDFTAKRFDVTSGGLALTYSGHTGGVLAVACSSDGRFVVTGSFDNTARLWDARSGAELRTFPGHSEAVTSVAISPDARLVATGSIDDTVKLWDAATGAELKTLSGHANDVTAVAFTRDGRKLLTASFDYTAKLWDVESGAVVSSLRGHEYWLNSVALSADDRFFVTGSQDKTARLWETATGTELARFSGRINLPWSAAFSPDARFIVVSHRDGTARLWEGATGEQVYAYSGHGHWVTSAAYSADGARLLTGSWDTGVRVWDAASGERLQMFDELGEPVTSVAFSPDGARVLAGGWDGAVKLWDARSGAVMQSFAGRGEPSDSTAFSPDGRFVASCRDGRAVLWDAATGAEVRTFAGHMELLEVRALAFSPDGRLLLTGGGDATAKLWDVASGAELRTFSGHGDTVDAVAFSPDGRLVLTASSDQTARIWDAATGAELRALTGHRGLIHSISVSADGRFILTAGADGTVRLWDLATARPLCNLISFDDGSWAVIDPEGRFDAANGGEVEGLHWATAAEPIALFQLKERYYVPALLARILGFDNRPLEQVTALDRVTLFPDVRVGALPAAATRLTIQLTDRGGGIGKVRVLVNRKEFVADARVAKAGADTATLVVDLAQAPALAGEPNRIEVISWNEEGYLSSRGVVIPWTPPAGEPYEPALYAIIGGISQYASPAMGLRFAAKDAVDMATAIELGAKRLFGAERVHLTLLATADDPRAIDPTKDNFRQAFEAARRARPGDLLFVYLAGHGTAVAGDQKLYAYFTREALGFNLADPEMRKRRAITSEELTDWIKQIPALKQVMVLDTCAAGLAAARLFEQRAVSGEQLRALERLKDRTGFHVLMGSAADAVSYEASRYGQGLLTYTLLQAMKGAALRNDEFVDVGALFQYAADEVPRLARNLGGIQRPQIAAPKGVSFDIGQLGREEREQIPLPSPRPLVIRPLLFNPEAADDDLQLSVALKKALRTLSAESSSLVFVDADDCPDAVRVSGVYHVRDGRVSIKATLRRERVELGTVTLEAPANDPAAAAAELARAIALELAAP